MGRRHGKKNKEKLEELIKGSMEPKWSLAKDEITKRARERV